MFAYVPLAVLSQVSCVRVCWGEGEGGHVLEGLGNPVASSFKLYHPLVVMHAG